jgi:hypothetical protein
LGKFGRLLGEAVVITGIFYALSFGCGHRISDSDLKIRFCSFRRRSPPVSRRDEIMERQLYNFGRVSNSGAPQATAAVGLVQICADLGKVERRLGGRRGAESS